MKKENEKHLNYQIKKKNKSKDIKKGKEKYRQKKGKEGPNFSFKKKRYKKS